MLILIAPGRLALVSISTTCRTLYAHAIGGINVTQTVEGLERYPVNLRYPQRARDSVEQLRLLPIVTPQGARIALADVADVTVVDGPAGDQE